MYSTSFRVSKSVTVGKLLIDISKYWNIKTDF